MPCCGISGVDRSSTEFIALFTREEEEIGLPDKIQELSLISDEP
jgi:hypothetical protein